jgi:hypothetical protein
MSAGKRSWPTSGHFRTIVVYFYYVPVREAVRELGFHLIFSYGHLIPPVPPGD